jgi:alpha-galactosidase
MQLRARQRLALALWLAVSVNAACQTTASLRTQQTTLTFEAGAEAPRLIGLQGSDREQWVNLAREAPISFVLVHDKRLPLHWRFNAAESVITRNRIVFVYESESPKLRLTWEWNAPSTSGPIEHQIHIDNLSASEVWIPLQYSFRFNFKVNEHSNLKQLYIDKGAGRPTDTGTHEVALTQGYRWQGISSSYAENGDTREIIPWFMVDRSNSDAGWYAGVEFSGRVRMTLERNATSLSGVVGLNPEPEGFRTRLLPKQRFDTPKVFVGAFTEGADGAGNILRPWIRKVLMNPATWDNPSYPLVVNNSWGSGMAVDEALAKKMIRDSADLGVDMFHLDAGWFRGVGDWYPDATKFPHGLAAISDYAHAHGLKFGMWTNWAEAGTDTQPGALNVHRVMDWLVADVPSNWKPDEFVGRTIDLGLPAAHDYAQAEVERIVQTYRPDMLEHDGYVVAKRCLRSDHPHAAPGISHSSTVAGRGLAMPDLANSTDVSYHATRAYYDIQSHLRQQHPDLLLEICNDGGRMVDFGSAAHGDYFSITDAYDPVSNRRAFYDANHVLPAAMLETYVERWPTPRIENFRYMLRSGMMGWLTVMQDTTSWTAEQHNVAKEEIALYKRELRPLIRDADLYHISQRADGAHWDGMEYFDLRSKRGVVYAFHSSSTNDAQHRFVLSGLHPNAHYRLRFRDHTSPDRVMSGAELLHPGLLVNLPVPDSSELIFFSEIA